MVIYSVFLYSNTAIQENPDAIRAALETYEEYEDYLKDEKPKFMYFVEDEVDGVS